MLSGFIAGFTTGITLLFLAELLLYFILKGYGLF